MLVVALALDSPAAFDYDYEADDEDDWQPGLSTQPLNVKGRRGVFAGRPIGPVFLQWGTGSFGVEEFCPAPAADLSGLPSVRT